MSHMQLDDLPAGSLQRVVALLELSDRGALRAACRLGRKLANKAIKLLTVRNRLCLNVVFGCIGMRS